MHFSKKNNKKNNADSNVDADAVPFSKLILTMKQTFLYY